MTPRCPPMTDSPPHDRPRGSREQNRHPRRPVSGLPPRRQTVDSQIRRPTADPWIGIPTVDSRTRGPTVGSWTQRPTVDSRVRGPTVDSQIRRPTVGSRVRGPIVDSGTRGPTVCLQVWRPVLSSHSGWRALSRLPCRDSTVRGVSERRNGASEPAGEARGTLGWAERGLSDPLSRRQCAPHRGDSA